jgi:hypothetical protein
MQMLDWSVAIEVRGVVVELTIESGEEHWFRKTTRTFFGNARIGQAHFTNYPA